jgi:peroxiredoxin
VLRRPGTLLALSALAALLPGAAPARGAGPAEPERAEDFALLDHEGRFHRLSDHADARAVVLFVQGNGCPIARAAIPALKALREELGPRGVVLLGLNANPQDGRERVATEAREFGIDLPILIDETQLVAESLGVVRTAEALVLATPGFRIAYRGPVDDSRHYGATRPAREHYLRDALRAVLDGRPVAAPVREAPGCLIHFAPRERLSYGRDVAPLLARRCAGCHREGGAAPFAMTSHALVRGFGPMLREVVRTRRMPPWDADPAIGRFANASGLTTEEARTLVHWVEDGAPRGEGVDPLERPAPEAAGWALGAPDLVVAAPPQEIPASGVVPYVYETIDLPLQRDVWVRGVDLQPTNLRAMHHGIAWIEPPAGRELPGTEGPRFTRGLLAGYVPGREVHALPEGTGYFLPAGSRIRFQLHYTTTGRAERDTPRLALYLADRALAHELHTGAVASFDFAIPPGAPDHGEIAERTLSRDLLVYRWMPHMHYRGKSMRYEAHYPDGRSELLLSVPSYRFAWQRQYLLEEPKPLPAGTRLVVRATFDNSARNPANPDPAAWVRYGEQSFEEMLFGYFLYRDLVPAREPGYARAAREPRQQRNAR